MMDKVGLQALSYRLGQSRKRANKGTDKRTGKQGFLNRVSLGLMLLTTLLGVSAVAWSENVAKISDPYEVVEAVTDEVLNVVGAKQALLDEDPQAFYAAVGEVLSSVVAFDYIAYGVMGDYAKQATPEQRQRFSEVFRENLISTYAKGMAVYGQQKIVLVRPEGGVGDKDRIGVEQKVQTDEGEHTVTYTMAKSKRDNAWKLLNVTINGINLGKTFRSQFSQAMRKAGNLDAVIEGWSASANG
ncbi:ABC transporter substrate-binding protein [Aestuariicella hydrocarbonica]|uniref:ABC transporter substrate-binding protein n=1 Tax=Pseudomaricurvus hydrocarbonicus TaxID=1470433 RepID=A0A9E5JPW4_9GAMM|nr:ABC transporter substrate-binding protein [Aestuariicella hydrocarbonica]NHO64304.1 ABC transporter substrate-binding protein [Aestuariicella hydrocarbonica]